MKYTKELEDIINKKNFIQFFQLLEYLLLAGYKDIDAFAITLKFFPENKIWENVAFIRGLNGYNVNNQKMQKSYFRGENDYRMPENDILLPIPTSKEYTLLIGVLDNETLHLNGLFDLYMKDINSNKVGKISDLESNCNHHFKFREFTPFLKQYLFNSFKKHFSYDLNIEELPF